MSVDKPDFMREFWWWVYERQNVYWRREKGNSPPWTEDPILRDYFFTNCYRELDAGTQYYLDNIASLDNPRDIVFDTLAYRYFNNEPTWDFLCSMFGKNYVPWGLWNHKQVAFWLSKWEHKGNRVFTSAFTVTGVRFGNYPDKISNVCWLVEYFQTQTKYVANQLVHADNLRQVFDIILNLQGMGAFLAYEVAVDLNYTWLTKETVTEDDFVNPGPGCRRGINFIYPTRRDYIRVIRELRENQDRYFDTYGFRFKRYGGKDLTLRNIEHSLCEFSKYARTKFQVDCDGTHISWKTRRYIAKSR